MNNKPTFSTQFGLKLLAVVGLVVAVSATGCIVVADDEGDSLDMTRVALSAPEPTGYSFQRSTKASKKSVAINKNADWHVLYSVPLKDLTPGERLIVRGEVQLTTCQQSDVSQKSPCKRVTPFAPTFKAKVVLAKNDWQASGSKLSDTKDITCTHFKHHCAVALNDHTTAGWSGNGFANLVVAAVDNNATNKDLMEVENHGGLYVTRVGAKAKTKGAVTDGKKVAPSWMRLDMENKHPRKEHTTLRATLKNVKPGDVIGVKALIVANTRGSGGKPAGCSGARDPLLTHQVFLSRTKDEPTKSGNRIAAVTPKNGINCKIGGSCKYHKFGAYQLPKGVPSTVYVSVVSMGGRSCSAPSDEWQLGGASFLTVDRLRAAASAGGGT